MSTNPNQGKANDNDSDESIVRSAGPQAIRGSRADVDQYEQFMSKHIA